LYLIDLLERKKVQMITNIIAPKPDRKEIPIKLYIMMIPTIICKGAIKSAAN
jgi:hypothetical protein